ncbi:MAG TPA: cytochrome b/b6 domain-containing protein [Dehalococcoidia bacterium]|nr:cytochrome b/b6 domain-containing protein [Dehalococcoidia bacterium]
MLRFEAGIRLIHWVHAVPFLFLLVTGLTLFIQPIKAAHIDGYRIVPLLHVLAGLGFIASPLALLLWLRTDRASADDIHRLFSLRREDVPWARYAVGAVLGARVRIPPTAKFNLGQKANAVITVAVTAALMLSGAVLAVNFFTKRVFSAGLVEGVFPLHDLFMLIALPVVLVHIYLGSLHPGTRESLRGIISGRVSRGWARDHHDLWVEEIESRNP